jgi:hypothetical protein
MIIGGELEDSSTVTAGYNPVAGRLTYAVEAKPLPAGGAATPRGGKRPINSLDPMGYMVDEPDDGSEDDDEMRD